METKLVKRQVKHETKLYKRKGISYKSIVNIRYDDQCENGHNTFSITLDTYEKRGNRFIEYAFGCQHSEIKKLFPQYAKYIKWHLCSSDGPMYYIENTIYHAKNRKLKYARSCAIWSSASIEQLKSKIQLMDRLPKLMLEFKKDVKQLGFIY